MFRVGGRRVLGQGVTQKCQASSRFASSDAANRIAGGAFIRNVVVSTALGASAYAGGALYSLEDSDFRKSFEWVPGGSEAISVAQQVKEQTQSLTKQAGEAIESVKKSTESTFESTQKALGSYTDSAKKAVDNVSSTVTKAIDTVQGKKSDEGAPEPKPASVAAPEEKKQEPPKPSLATAWKKPAEPKPPADAPAKTSRPSKAVAKPSPPPAKSVPKAEPVPEEDIPVAIRLAAAVEALNKELQTSTLSPEAKSAILQQLDRVDKQLKVLEKEQTVLVGAAVADTVSHFNDELTKLVETYQKTLADTKTSLESAIDSHVAEVREQVSAAKDAEARDLLASQAAEFERTLHNALTAQAEAIQGYWRREVKERVDRERGGRLARLDGLELKLKVLEMVAKENGESAARMDSLRRLRIAVTSLRQVVADDSKKPLGKQLSGVGSAGRSDDLAQAVLDSVTSKGTVMEGIAPVSELERWWSSSVRPAIRKTALMPDDGGFVSYTISSLLSYVTFPKSGTATGNDVEAIVARADQQLKRGDLDGAAREVNQLGGWPKKVAHDWLNAARRRLEVEQAVQVLETEVSLLELGLV